MAHERDRVRVGEEGASRDESAAAIIPTPKMQKMTMAALPCYVGCEAGACGVFKAGVRTASVCGLKSPRPMVVMVTKPK